MNVDFCVLSLLRGSNPSSGLLGGLLGRKLPGDCLLHGGLLCRGGSSRGGSLFGRCGFLGGIGFLGWSDAQCP